MSKRTTEVKLSDGKTAIVKKPKVQDMIDAYQKVTDQNNQLDITAAMVSNITEIDGKPLIYEDFKQMDLDDGNLILAAMGKFMGNPEQLLKSLNIQAGNSKK